MTTQNKRIVVGVTGSVAAFKAAQLVSQLVQRGFDVRVVMTKAALEFVGQATFEALSQHKVYSSTFEEGEVMSHISLARWADLTVVYPATANTLAKFAAGLGDDLLSTLFLAQDFKHPFWIAPAMNPAMFIHPAIREACAKLESWGAKILKADTGRMACGEVGEGRLLEVDVLLEEVTRYFTEPFFTEPLITGRNVTKSSVSENLPPQKSAAEKVESKATPVLSPPASAKKENRRVLVTAGGTIEPIDPVRVLTNTSTGETGIRIAQSLAELGHKVTLLLSQGSTHKALLGPLTPRLHIQEFANFEDLDQKMKAHLATERFDWVIHAAAVSDYTVEGIEDVAGRQMNKKVKIHSGKKLKLLLKPTPKIVNRIRAYSGGKPLRVISFKLTTALESKIPHSGGNGVDREQNAARDFASGLVPDLSGYDSDFIVHNDLSQLDRAGGKHAGKIYQRAPQHGSQINSDALIMRAPMQPKLVPKLESLTGQGSLRASKEEPSLHHVLLSEFLDKQQLIAAIGSLLEEERL